MFAAALVAWVVAFLGDGMVKGVRRGVLGKPEHRALVKAISVAVTATLDQAPEDSRTALAMALQDRFDEPPVLVHDGRTRVRTVLMRAIQAQLAPLADSSITPGGKSFFEEIGVDSAQIRDDLTDAIMRSIEQVGPAFPTLSPLVNQLNADAIIERVDNVAEMIGAAERELPQPTKDSTFYRQGKTSVEMPEDRIEKLTTAFLDVPAIADDELRQTVLDLLPARFRLAIPRSRYPKIQVIQMIRTSANYAGGMRAMLGAVRMVEGDTVAMQRLDHVILCLGGTDDATGCQGNSGAPDA